ncbi:protein DpdJ [Tautonia plasticadhaerens]|uniref:Putative ATP-dependent helicase Lhr n=1 Tax=Tautonia plasticadhaerens TaxID=2527974 RepID=A0A518H989_9BACT|nr:protein DpdJ [Tautonia plasticadhaerens]QDV37412.1 putative ATP-dependent helicase Lhr [Tautonia plasticadhaerens]
MIDGFESVVRHFLDVLEREESKLLSWGVVDGGFTAEEIEEHAEAAIASRGIDLSAGELRDELIDRKLLFPMLLGSRQLYRTRMAEAVRLLARLRQLFPGRPWRIAPTLVADFRFDRRPRRYPTRHLDPAAVLEAIGAEVRLSAPKRKALELLLRANRPDALLLADFQFQALRRILLDLNESRSSRGVIVGAGTGTGKTLAFFLPALSHLAGLVERASFWTKGLAIYPRNELLKDQFSEAYTEARRLDGLLTSSAGRKLAIGAFFGPTPHQAGDLSRYSTWAQAPSGGYLCPFLRCPNCEGDLVWPAELVARNAEELRCERAGCGTVLRGDEVLLTRSRMSQTPPDLLFTTTEMLNRQMGDSRYGHIFGLGPRVRRPQVLLLDEVHTYAGVSGAQVALLLRRWHHAVGSKVQFTGLSATLRSAAEYFGQLVGLRSGAVEEVSPRDGEFDRVPESDEYLLALRGDPGSGTSLLSTSIQTAMLLRRVLDPATGDPSGGLFGRRVFVFTDDLDVTNRLYNNLQDAEGLDSWNRPRAGAAPLAALRSSAAPENAARLLAGQSWQVSEDVGHPFRLARPLRIGRTSSQDVGVDRASDVIVATAALEVGYNDPDVGAVMQHKAPRDWAAFLQRKGRAGRRRSMRPWTVVVLSDYGRDRLAYQAYDELFDPELPLRKLPVANRYVLRMQAAFAFMDWLAGRLPAELPEGSLWRDLSGPPRGTGPWADATKRRQEWVCRVLVDLIEGVREVCDPLEAYLQDALGITAEETRAILWDPPRPIYTAVVPTLLRRLESRWRRVPATPEEPDTDLQINDHPLPDFVPQQLFGDLNLPEVEVVVPPQIRNQDTESHFLPIVQALRTLAPGRVTRRFGYKHAFANHWVAPPDLTRTDQTFFVGDLCTEYQDEGDFQVWGDHGVDQVRCLRPWKMTTTPAPGAVLPTSNAQLEWRSQLSPAREDDRLRFEPPRGSAWASILDEIRFYTHNHHNHVQVRRFAVASWASLSFRDGSQTDTVIRFAERNSGRPAALGFTQESDGIVCRFRVPDDLGLSPGHPNQRKVRSFRTAYFRERVQHEPAIGLMTNHFQREWLSQIYLSALITRAAADSVPLDEAHRRLHAASVSAEMERVLDVIFQSLEDPNGNGPIRQRVHGVLLALCRDPAVTRSLESLAPLLWIEPDEGYRAWAAERFKATLGGALLEACQLSCPQLESADLVLDLGAGPRPPEAPAAPEGLEEIWVTESTIGGGGVVEEVLRAYTADPRHFFRLVESALAPTDFESVDRELSRVAERITTDPGLAEAFADMRSAEGHAALQGASANLRRDLAARGFTVNHALVSALHARVLRPGSSPATDSLLRDLVVRWREEEMRLGIEIDPRVFAFVAAESAELQGQFAAIGPFPHHDPFWRYQVIYGLLWPRGFQVRSEGLSFFNPYASSPPPDREILLDLIRVGEATVSLGPDWAAEVQRTLAGRGAVRLSAPIEGRRELKEALLALGVEPVEVGFLHLFPHVAEASEEQETISITLDLREVLP